MSAERTLAAAFLDAHPKEAARVLESFDPAACALVLQDGPVRPAAAALAHMDPRRAAQVVAGMHPQRVIPVLEQLPLGLAGRLLRQLGETEREGVLAAAPAAHARSLRLALQQSESTAGALMDPFVLAVSPETTVGEARRLVKRRAKQVQYYLYVVDGAHRPIGALNLREMMIAPARAAVGDLMRSPAIHIGVRAGDGAILAHPGWNELHALPVVDDAGTLVGVLRHETLQQLRGRADASLAEAQGAGLVALTEMLWKVGAAMVDEMAGAVRPRETALDQEGKTDGTQ